jgi:NADH-quinone oxidoreductase subunit C
MPIMLLSPDEVGARLVAALSRGKENAEGSESQAGAVASVSGGGAWARATVDVPAEGFHDAMLAARDALGCDFFDWLSAVDELEDGFSIVAHVWSVADRHGVLVRCRVPRADARVASIVDVYPGAAWPERETHEMFDIAFDGHDGMKALLLPPEFEGHPLRKEFVLASRVAKPWPGAKEPGESHDANAARRAPMRPPGVPDPSVWGPAATRGEDA